MALTKVRGAGVDFDGQDIVLDADGDTKIAAGTDDIITISTAGSERLRVLAAGGLTFNGDTAAANAIDDFEQGTWTPTSAYGTVSSAYAHYIKVGNMVTVWTQLSTFSDSSGNSLYVEGLPYASASNFAGTGLIMHRNANISNEDDLTAYIGFSASNFRFFKIRANGAWSTLTYSLLSSSHEFYIHLSYLTS